MKAETLRKSILQYAIQGKLVKQIETEEPAIVLLGNIKAKKQELISQGKIKNEKSLPPVTDDEKPFDLPESWEWVRFNDVAVLFTGDSINADEKKKKYTDLAEGYNYIATKDVGFDNVIDYGNGVRIPFQTNFKVAKANSSLLCIEGGSAGRKVGILNQDVCFGNKLCSFEPILINELYLFYFLQSPVFTDYFRDNKTGMIGGVGVNTLKTLLFELPPLAEQKRIVARIEELMLLVAKYEKKEVELAQLEKEFPEKLKKSILQYAIQGKLVEQLDSDGLAKDLLDNIRAEKQKLNKKGKLKKNNPLTPITEDEKPFDIPDSWEWARIFDVLDIATNLQPPQMYQELLHIAPDNIEKYTGKLLDCRTIKEDGVISNKHLFFKGQLLYSKIRPALRKVVIAEFDGMCSADMYPLNVHISTDYLLYYILSDEFTKQVVAKDTRVKMPKVNQEELATVAVPVPPLTEQQRIVARIEELFALVDLLTEGKKLKTTIKSVSNEQQIATILEMPTKQDKAKFDVSSLGLVARADSGVSEQTIASVLKQVKDHYDKKN